MPRFLTGLSFVVACTLPLTESHCVVKTDTCYEDGNQRRVLSWPGRKAPQNHDLTREGCMQICHDKGYLLAGVEYGSQCFCGNATSSGAVKGDGCKGACDGNASETCGGSNHINVLSFSCSGASDPTPPPSPMH